MEEVAVPFLEEHRFGRPPQNSNIREQVHTTQLLLITFVTNLATSRVVSSVAG